MPARKKSTPLEMTAKLADTISDGKGGYLKKGDKFEAVDEAAAESLKAKGYAE